jgi:hypothetical protein
MFENLRKDLQPDFTLGLKFTLPSRNLRIKRFNFIIRAVMALGLVAEFWSADSFRLSKFSIATVLFNLGLERCSGAGAATLFVKPEQYQAAVPAPTAPAPTPM